MKILHKGVLRNRHGRKKTDYDNSIDGFGGGGGKGSKVELILIKGQNLTTIRKSSAGVVFIGLVVTDKIITKAVFKLGQRGGLGKGRVTGQWGEKIYNRKTVLKKKNRRVLKCKGRERGEQPEGETNSTQDPGKVLEGKNFIKIKPGGIKKVPISQRGKEAFTRKRGGKGLLDKVRFC